jgi:hypothetical protein
MRKIGWLCGLALLAMAGAPALAQDQAATIKQDVEAALKPLTGTGMDDAMLSYAGIDVAGDGGGYVVTIADLRGAPGSSGYLEFGNVSFRLTPEGEDAYRVDEVQIPAQIPHKAPDGGSDGSISLPSQQFTGVWSRSLATFLQLDAAYRDVKVDAASENTAISLGELAARIASTDKGGGRFDQSSTFRLAALNVTSPDGVFSLGSVDGSSDTRDYNAQGWKAIMDQIEAMAAGADGGAAPAATPALVETLRGVGALFASSISNVKLGAISFRDPAGTEVFALPEGALSFGAEGFDQAVGRLTLSLNHRGLVVDMGDPAAKDLLPHELAINVALENLPVQELWTGALDTFATADMTTDDGATMAMMMYMSVLQQALVNGKAKLSLTDWRVANALAQAQLSGLIETSAEAMMGVIGQLTLDVTGLDKVIEWTQGYLGPQAEEVATLEMLRGFSNRQTGGDGAAVDHYEVSFTPQGQLLINGKEFNPMGPPAGDMPPPESTGN